MFLSAVMLFGAQQHYHTATHTQHTTTDTLHTATDTLHTATHAHVAQQIAINTIRVIYGYMHSTLTPRLLEHT